MKTKRTTAKAGRMLTLHWLKKAGSLAGMTMRQIGPKLDVSAATICRDLQQLENAEVEHERLKAAWDEDRE